MICRHPAGYHDHDRSDYSSGGGSSSVSTPDADNYQIEDSIRVGPHVCLKIKYPNCYACAFEGTKVLVYLDVTEAAILRWRKIDPHFREAPKTMIPTSAPSPAARFPASAEGWQDAIEYARSKAVRR